jgi:hypothetical protein
MQLQFDQVGFPLVSFDGVSVSLLPITKVQFERFIAEPNAFDDAWYDQVLGFNPRVSWRRLHLDRREELFITGVLPAEALAYAAWSGSGFDLPSVDEWRLMFRAMTETRLAVRSLRGLNSDKAHAAARAIVESILVESRPETWAELALARGGILEWVRDGENFKGLGIPRPQFLHNRFNPMEEPLQPMQDERSRYFGFRLVRRRAETVHRR